VRLDAAAAAYQEAIRQHLNRGDRRGAAVAKGQLAYVRLLQKRYDEALKGYGAARDTFQALGEPRTVAVIWHQIGMAHRLAGRYQASEQAYRESLAIKVRENNFLGQANTLQELGSLYSQIDRDEEAVTFYQQAAEILVRSESLAREGLVRYNLADTLVKLRRYPEARQELQRAIECNEPYGHAAEPWMTWSTLEELERATGHPDEAQAARNQAIETYLAYRRDGGDSQSNQFSLFSVVARAAQENTQDQAARQLNDLLESDDPPSFTALIRQLRSVLAGNRDPALATDLELDYREAAELQLLLNTLKAEPDQLQP
jgi:tetratricopeptide (TPR) repeat protein